MRGARARAKAPLCRVGWSMNLLKQVEPLEQAALQASSLQRHAHGATSRLTWVNIGSTSHPPSRAKQGTRTLPERSYRFSGQGSSCERRPAQSLAHKFTELN